MTMARGFESKSVADQQEAAQDRWSRSTKEPVSARRRRLELARQDVRGRLEKPGPEPYREMLRRTLAALDEELGRVLDDP